MHGDLLQIGILGHRAEQRPVFPVRQAEHLADLAHLVTLEGHRLLSVLLGFLAFKDGPQRQELGEDAADGPEVDGGRVVSASEQQFGGTVPDCHDDFIAGEEGVQGLEEEAREAEVADLDAAAGGHHDVCGFQVAVYDPVLVEVEQAGEQLVHCASEAGGRDWSADE